MLKFNNPVEESKQAILDPNMNYSTTEALKNTGKLSLSIEFFSRSVLSK